MLKLEDIKVGAETDLSKPMPNPRHIEVKAGGKAQSLLLCPAMRSVMQSIRKTNSSWLRSSFDGDRTEGSYYIRNSFEHEPE